MAETKTPEFYEAEARRYAQEREDSFDRCDTDGFLTQWACGLQANQNTLAAEIARNAGRARFCGLYEIATGRRVAAEVVDGQFGCQWFLAPSEAAIIARRGKRWLPTGWDSRVLRGLGLAQRYEWAPAEAKIVGEGRGLSGRAWAAEVRTGDRWGQDARACRPPEAVYPEHLI